MATDKRQALLQSTVQAVAKHGMKDVSTRSISGAAGINDAYIYRYFKDKEDMLVQAYLMENEKFMRHVLRHLEKIQLQMDVMPFEDRFRYVLHIAWRYLLDTPDVCRFFMYYYHSPSFEKYAQEAYRAQMDLLAGKLTHLFNSLEDARHCLYTLYVLLISFAIQAATNEVPDNAETEERAIRTVYNAIRAEMKTDAA